MAPLRVPGLATALHHKRADPSFGDWRSTDDKETYVVEGWGEGFLVGALLIMALITIANMRKGVLLHKLIFLELLLAMSHGTFCFMSFKGYGWYLSSTAALLYCSYFTHNVVSWLKIRPFFRQPQATFRPWTCKLVRWTYLSTLAMTGPVLIFEIFNNFRYFNDIDPLYTRVRPYEPLMRDPWWIFACLVLFHVIRKCYSVNVFKLVRKSPRFGILLASIFLAVIFTICDIIASVDPAFSLTDGINPWWKLALVFRCLTDNIMLDDFKSVLQRLGAMKLNGRNAMLDNSINMIPDEKAGQRRDDADEYRPSMDGSPYRPSGRRSRESTSRTSFSGRLLDEGETLDERGYSRRKESMTSSGVAKVGKKIKKLGGLAALRSSAEREAKRNMELNKKASGNSSSSRSMLHSDSQQSRTDEESIDFITSVLR